MDAMLPRPCLMLVTDRRRCLVAGRSLEEQVERAIAGGVNAVQLREKDLPGGELLRLALRLRQATRGKALLLVNDRLDVALAAGADGGHLGEQALPVAVAKGLVPQGFLVGRSVHSVEAGRQAEADGADYLVAGAIFPSVSHPGGPVAGLDLIRRLRQAVRIQVIGIGGITPDRALAVMRAGGDGVAVISALLDADDPAAEARAFLQSLSAQSCVAQVAAQP